MDPAKLVRFGVFEADLSTCELRKHGISVKLQEQPAKILAALLEHPGEVVSREDLIKLLWPDGTFVDYDRGLNAAINRLRQALSDSAESPRYVETVARRGYRFLAPVETTIKGAGPGGAARTGVPTPPRAWIATMGGVIAIAVGIWLWRSRETPESLLAPVPLTTYDGLERDPSFSPDASQIAFSWDGPKQDNVDIYVKVIGTGSPVRLTTDQAVDRFPAWSPDGRWLAFLRESEGIYLVPPIGGTERKILEWPGIASPLSWSKDGRYLAVARERSAGEVAGIFGIPVQGGAGRRLTTAADPGFDNAPAFSPDGRWLAFASCRGPITCALSALELADGLNPRGPARLLAPVRGFIDTIAWTADGKAVVFSQPPGALPPRARLWKVTLEGQATPQLLNFAEPGSLHPALSRSGFRMAYSHLNQNVDIWSLANGVVKKSPLSSTVIDYSPQFSPDGTRVAFSSVRSGIQEVWVANPDGSDAVQLTTSLGSGSPRWSPDGRRIVYDTMQEDRRFDIRVISAEGGQPTPVASHPANDKIPSFSRDGKWIYFSSNRNGADDIYRVPMAGGDPIRLTGQGGWVALESVDAASIYYTKEYIQCGPLFVRSLEGGPERKAVDSVCMRNFEVTERGIFYIGGSLEDRLFTIQLLDPATGKSRAVGRTEGSLILNMSLTVSPDGKTVLFAATHQTGADLMLVENFR